MRLRDELDEALTEGETSCFRDEHPFEEFRGRILHSLAHTIRQQLEIGYPPPVAKIWSAGCSTGQEPDSLAMCIQSFFGGNPAVEFRADNFLILATDVSGQALATARKGRFPGDLVDRELSSELRQRFSAQKTTRGQPVKRCVD